MLLQNGISVRNVPAIVLLVSGTDEIVALNVTVDCNGSFVVDRRSGNTLTVLGAI